MSAALQNSRNRNRSRQPQPVPGRGGYPSYKRELSDPEPPSSSPLRGLYGDPRTAMVMCSFMGTRTSVKTRNGSTFKGHTVGFSDQGDIAMSDAKLEDDDNSPNQSLPGLIIPRENFVVCKTNGVDLKGLCSSTVEFTDSAIATRINGSSDASLRELQPWQDDDAPDEQPSLSLDDPNVGWDSHSMFQANREKFNVKSTYSEDLLEYTTKLPDPGSEGYEALQKFAQKQADEIERSDTYQSRIAKELADGDEELRYSAVHRGGADAAASFHRPQEVTTNSGKHVYTIPALRGDSDQAMKNGTLKGQGRGARHGSSYFSSSSHPQQPPHLHHQNLQQSARQMNNHYQGPPPSGGLLGRGHGPPSSVHSRHQGPQNHSPVPQPHHQQHHPQQYQQQPPPPPPPAHPGMHQHHHHPLSQLQQQPPLHHHHHPRPPPQQLVLTSSPHLGKPHPQTVPTNLSPPSLPPQQPLTTIQHPLTPAQHPLTPAQHPLTPAQHPLTPAQHPPTPAQHPPTPTQHPPTPAQHAPTPAQHALPQRTTPPHSQAPFQQPHPPNVVKVASVNGPGGPVAANLLYRQASVESKNGVEVISQKVVQMEVNQQVFQQKPSPPLQPVVATTNMGPKVSEAHLSASSSSSSLADVQQMGQSGPGVTSPPTVLVADRRVGQDERNKIGQSLHDFKRNFVLESNGAGCQDPARLADSSTPASSTPASSSVATTPVSAAPELVNQLAEQAADVTLSHEEELQLTPKSTLNPNAKEFKPKSQSSPMEAQSPSPQPRTSPHTSPHMPQMLPYPQQVVLMPYHYSMPGQLNPQRKRATVSLGAGVVSDLAAHQVTGQPLLATQPTGMMYIHTPGQPIPAGYQFYSPQIFNPRMVAPGSFTMAQAGQMAGLEQAGQNQPQPVFMTATHQPLPAHMHPQPGHGQPMPHPSSGQQVQAHVPNPAPSPVQQHSSQPLPHLMSQGPSQPGTPQPAHYPQMTISYTHGIPAAPRTSISGQQNMTAGHPSMNFMSASPQFTFNGGTAAYTFSPGPQPQAPQTSPHGSGPQTHQYVVMPQPNPQGHQQLQQHHPGQQYTAVGISYQPQHLMQGPPQMPPSHTQNPNQASPQLIHAGMQACLQQQVPGGQPGIYMQVPSTLQYHPQ